AASLPADLAAEHNVTVIPLGIAVGEARYEDGQVPLAELLAKRADLVTTSAPSPGKVAAVLEAVLEHVDEVLVLTISHTMSSTFDSVSVGAREFGARVRVVDTTTAAGAEALVVLAAAARAGSGAGIEEVEATARETIDRVQLIAT